MHQVVMIAYEGADIIDIAGPMDVFATANEILAMSGKKAFYKLHVLAEEVGACATACGIKIVAEASWKGWDKKIDTLLISGGRDYRYLQENRELAGWINDKSTSVDRIVSICTGAFALAEAGVLNGRKATTHWMALDELKKKYKDIKTERDAIYVRDGNVYSSAGITSGIDLCLSLVEQDLGRSFAVNVARFLVVYLRRSGGQSQYSSRLRAQNTEETRLTATTDWLQENFHLPIKIDDMASRAGMSPRNFARCFVAELETTPAKYLEMLRLEHSISLLGNRSLTLYEIADKCGFKSTEQFRRAFLRHYGINPQDYRNRF